MDHDYGFATTERVPEVIGSGVDLIYRATPASFRLFPELGESLGVHCCRCKKIGMVQIIKTDIIYYDTGWGVALFPSRYFADWHVDRGIPYPLGGLAPSSGVICPVAEGVSHVDIGLSDEPGPELQTRFGQALPNNNLVAATQEAEACAICLDGREGQRFGAGRVCVYGCISWYHHFHETGSGLFGATGFEATRIIQGVGGTTTVPAAAIYKADGKVGDGPSDRFIELLKRS